MTKEFKKHCMKCPYHKRDGNPESGFYYQFCSHGLDSILESYNAILWIVENNRKSEGREDEECPLYLEYVVSKK